MVILRKVARRRQASMLPKFRARRQARFLDLDERCRSKRDAGLVEAAGTPALAIGTLHQIAWRASGISRFETLTAES